MSDIIFTTELTLEDLRMASQRLLAAITVGDAEGAVRNLCAVRECVDHLYYWLADSGLYDTLVRFDAIVDVTGRYDLTTLQLELAMIAAKIVESAIELESQYVYISQPRDGPNGTCHWASDTAAWDVSD